MPTKSEPKYRIDVFYSSGDEGFIAVIPELPGCSAFGETKEKAWKEIQVAQELWLEVAKKEKRPIPEPIAIKKETGKFPLRLAPELKRDLRYEATEHKISLNKHINFILATRHKTKKEERRTVR